MAAMAMGVGYLIAAGGPALVGAVFDVTGTWTLPVVVLLVMTAAQWPAALYSGGRSADERHADVVLGQRRRLRLASRPCTPAARAGAASGSRRRSAKRWSIEVIHHEKCCTRQTRCRAISE